MTEVSRPRGRRGRYVDYEDILREVPAGSMSKRPRYVRGIGILRGARGDTVYVKILLRNGGTYRGKTYAPGQYLEAKLGSLDSFTWEQLEAIRDDLKGRSDRGEPLEDQGVMMFSEYADVWLGHASKRLVRRGYLNTRSVVERYLKPAFSKPLSAISVEDVNRFQTEQLSLFNPATVKRRVTDLNSILNAAVKSGHLERNPAALANRITVPEARPRVITEDELGRLLKSASEIRDWLPDLILWSVLSGMRPGEVRNLKWSEIVTDGRRTYAEFLTGKTMKIRRVVCSDMMIAILDRQRERTSEESDNVFPYSESTIRRVWDRLRKLSGITNVSPQHLRVTSATYAASDSVSLRALSGRLGHSDLSMLGRHYAAVEDDASMEVAESIATRVSRIMTDDGDVK